MLDSRLFDGDKAARRAALMRCDAGERAELMEVDGEVGMDVMGEVLSWEDVLLVLAEDSVGVGSVDEGVDDISSPFMLTRYDKDTFCPWYRGPHGGQDHPLRSPQ